MTNFVKFCRSLSVVFCTPAFCRWVLKFKSMFKKYFIVILLGLITFSCNVEDENSKKISDTERFNVVKFFEVDSISIYRFTDKGRSVYFTSRKSEVFHRTIQTKTVYKGVRSKVKEHQTICN